MAQSSNSSIPVHGPPPAFAELGRLLHDDQPLSATLQRVAELVRETVPELCDASVTLIDGGRPRTVVFTGALAVDLDERQYVDGFGPCTDAALLGNTILVDTEPPGDGYPDFAELAASRGVTRVLSVGLTIPRRTVGALNMYSSADAPFTATSVALAETFAGYAAVAIANAVVYREAVDLTVHLRSAMQTRAVIEQAKGILAARNHCTTDEAFTTLSQMSQRTHVKLREIATRLVANAVSDTRTPPPRQPT